MSTLILFFGTERVLVQFSVVVNEETLFLFMVHSSVNVMLCLQEGTSNYFKGLMLLFCYLIVAASFFVHRDPKSVGE